MYFRSFVILVASLKRACPASLLIPCNYLAHSLYCSKLVKALQAVWFTIGKPLLSGKCIILGTAITVESSNAMLIKYDYIHACTYASQYGVRSRNCCPVIEGNIMIT